MAGLNGLTGIAGYQQQVNEDAQATPEQRSGGTVDPKHGEWGETAHPYPYMSKAGQAAGPELHGPYGPENQMLGDEGWFWQPAGDEWQDPTFDHTPSRRAAPYPKGVASGPAPGVGPDDIAEQLRQSRLIHATNRGASGKKLTQLDALNDQWQEFTEENPGHSDLVPLPKQAMSSGFMYGTRDRTQSMARQNEFGYGSSHMHRRWAVGSIPGNSMWLKPGGRPLVKSLPSVARLPIGPTSPFAGDDVMQSFNIDGAILQNVPSEYATPPQVNLAPPIASDVNDSLVEWY